MKSQWWFITIFDSKRTILRKCKQIIKNIHFLKIQHVKAHKSNTHTQNNNEVRLPYSSGNSQNTISVETNLSIDFLQWPVEQKRLLNS